MSEELEEAQRFRTKAQTLRDFAADDRDAETRLPLIRVAEKYEHLASTLEAIDGQNKNAAKRP